MQDQLFHYMLHTLCVTGPNVEKNTQTHLKTRALTAFLSLFSKQYLEIISVTIGFNFRRFYIVLQCSGDLVSWKGWCERTVAPFSQRKCVKKGRRRSFSRESCKTSSKIKGTRTEIQGPLVLFTTYLKTNQNRVVTSNNEPKYISRVYLKPPSKRHRWLTSRFKMFQNHPTSTAKQRLDRHWPAAAFGLSGRIS